MKASIEPRAAERGVEKHKKEERETEDRKATKCKEVEHNAAECKAKESKVAKHKEEERETEDRKAAKCKAIEPRAAERKAEARWTNEEEGRKSIIIGKLISLIGDNEVNQQSVETLSDILVGKKGTKEQIQNGLERGKIRMGSPCKSVWGKFAERISSLPHLVRENEQKIPFLEQELLAKDKQEQSIANQIAALQIEQQQLQAEREEIKNRIQAAQRVSVLWKELIDHLPSETDIIQVTASLKDIEQTLLNEIERVIHFDPFAFSALNDSSDMKPKLSLVFNSYGMEKQLLDKLVDLDGDTFSKLTEEDLAFLFQLKEDEKQDLTWYKMLMKDKISDIVFHKEECVVCACETPNMLADLIEEHNLGFLSRLQIQQHKLNGPRILVVGLSYFNKVYGCSRTESLNFIQTLNYLHNLHCTN